MSETIQSEPSIQNPCVFIHINHKQIARKHVRSDACDFVSRRLRVA